MFPRVEEERLGVYKSWLNVSPNTAISTTLRTMAAIRKTNAIHDGLEATYTMEADIGTVIDIATDIAEMGLCVGMVWEAVAPDKFMIPS